MTLEVRDLNNKPLREGIYEVGTLTDPQYFRVSKRDDCWVAYDGNQTLELDYPRGMPDSSIMPEGKYDASLLRRVPEDRIPARTEHLRRMAERINRGLALLAQSQPKDKGSSKK